MKGKEKIKEILERYIWVDRIDNVTIDYEKEDAEMVATALTQIEAVLKEMLGEDTEPDEYNVVYSWNKRAKEFWDKYYGEKQ